MTAVSFENLQFSYDKQEILHGISAQITTGGIHALFGPNGSGKTTLLKCIAGILVPQHGTICVESQRIREMSAKERSRKLCYVPQEHQVSFAYSVEEVVLMGRTPHLGGVRGPSQKDLAAAEEAILEVGIQEIKTRSYTQLSGGQRQLVLIARALAQNSPIMILDEPTSALDFKNQMIVWQSLKNLQKKGKTILVCTHDPNHVLWFCDQVLVMKAGKLIAQGNAELLLDGKLLETLYGPICEVTGRTVRPRKETVI